MLILSHLLSTVLGDSGNTSPEFTIQGTDATTTAATATATATSS